MPAFRSNNFLEVHPVCSRLLIELTRDFLGSLNEDESVACQRKHVESLVRDGFDRHLVETAWRLIVRERQALDFRDTQSATRLASKAVSGLAKRHDALRAVEDVPSRAMNENVFSFEGGRWVVTYGGKTIYPQDISGIKYLHYLISHPDQAFSPTDLYAGFGERKQRKASNLLTVDEAFHNGVAFASAQSDVRVDQQGKEEMLARLEQIETEMAAAKLVPDADMIEKLASERLQITEELRKAFTPVGSRRIQEPDLVRRMKAVDIAIRRAKEKIQRAGHHDLFRHLSDAIEVKVKSGCRYSPGKEARWRTEDDGFSAPSQPR